MTTVTLDILDDKALNLLKDLESMNIIKLHTPKNNWDEATATRIKSYAGLMTKQSPEEIDRQLKDMRDEWD